MRCALVFHLVSTIFVAGYGVPKLCAFRGGGGVLTLCKRPDVNYTLSSIPPFSQHISLIDLRDQPFKQLPYNAFRNVSSQSSITKIVLRNCQISHVDAGALLNLHNLTDINLSHNNINHIDSKLFSDTKRIKHIYMYSNKIEVLPRGLFQNLPLLVEVVLYDKRIRQVERFSFKNTPSLRHIDLTFNQIESMDRLFKDKFDKLTTLRLYGNPWRCNCELGPLYELLIEINQLNQFALQCEEPPTLHGRYWRNISRDEFVCRSEDALSTRDSVGTQPALNQNWIEYTRSVLELVCVAAVIIGLVYVVRRTPTVVKRRSDRRTNARNMDRGLPMCVVQSSAVSENNDSASNVADVDEESQQSK